jgi:hypothetical protein
LFQKLKCNDFLMLSHIYIYVSSFFHSPFHSLYNLF